MRLAVPWLDELIRSGEACALLSLTANTAATDMKASDLEKTGEVR